MKESLLKEKTKKERKNERKKEKYEKLETTKKWKIKRKNINDKMKKKR